MLPPSPAPLRLLSPAPAAGSPAGGAVRRRRKRWFAQRDSIEARMKPGRPGTPRFQRYLNRCFLLELQEQLSGRGAVEQHYSGGGGADRKFVNVFGQPAPPGDDVVDHGLADLDDTYFSDVVSDAEAQRKWAPFVSIDLDDQDELMASLSSSCPQTPPKHDALRKRPHNISAKYWEPLRRSLRNAHYWNFVCCLEVYLTHFLSVVADLEDTSPDAIERAVECTRFVEEGEAVPFALHLERDSAKNRFPVMCVSLESSYHRLLCHALCSYYQVLSESCDAKDGTRVTQIRIGRSVSSLPADWEPSMPKTTLAAYLVNARERDFAAAGSPGGGMDTSF